MTNLRQLPLPPPKENLETLLKVEPLAVEVGLGLIKLVEGAQNSPLLRRISGIRKQLASDLGYLLPPVRVMDNVGLKVREYVISIKGVEVSRYELPQGCELAITTSRAAPQLEGHPDQGAGFRYCGRLGPIGKIRASAHLGVYGRGWCKCSGHPPIRGNSQARIRIILASRH